METNARRQERKSSHSVNPYSLPDLIREECDFCLSFARSCGKEHVPMTNAHAIRPAMLDDVVACIVFRVAKGCTWITSMAAQERQRLAAQQQATVLEQRRKERSSPSLIPSLLMMCARASSVALPANCLHH